MAETDVVRKQFDFSDEDRTAIRAVVQAFIDYAHKNKECKAWIDEWKRGLKQGRLEGMQEGQREGKREGKRELLLELVVQAVERSGLSESWPERRIALASDEDLGAWVGRLLAGEPVEEVLGESGP